MPRHELFLLQMHLSVFVVEFFLFLFLPYANCCKLISANGFLFYTLLHCSWSEMNIFTKSEELFSWSCPPAMLAFWLRKHAWCFAFMWCLLDILKRQVTLLWLSPKTLTCVWHTSTLQLCVSTKVKVSSKLLQVFTMTFTCQVVGNWNGTLSAKGDLGFSTETKCYKDAVLVMKENHSPMQEMLKG